jgi:hypothetical protein
VKTRKLNLRIEISSLLRQFEKAKLPMTTSGEDNRENNSAASSRSHVFTQPGPIGDIASARCTSVGQSFGVAFGDRRVGTVRIAIRFRQLGEILMPGTAIQTLATAQAVRAVGLFYDLLPGADKPSRTRIETVAARLRDKAPDEALPVVEGMFAPQNTEARGELARLVLERFSTDDQLKPYVDQAIARAAKPDMAIDPVSVTAIIALLVFLSPVIQKDGDKLKFTSGLVATLQQLHVDEIARQLPAILKALPESILRKLSTGV